jgi:transcription-repair coupling factor (superfamily II helicase)
MHILRIALLASFTLLIHGCSSEIDSIREGRLQDFPEYTVSQALDHRDMCQDTDWSTLTDDRGRKIVRYKCEMNDIEKYYYDLATELITKAEDKSIQNRLSSEIAKMKKELSDNQALIKQKKIELDNLNKQKFNSLEEGMEIGRQQSKIKLFLHANSSIAEKRIKSKIENHERSIEKHNLSDKENLNLGNYLLENHKGTAAFEVIDWLPIEDGTFMPVGGSLHEIETGESEFKETPHPNINHALALIYQNEPKHYFDYKEALGLY